MYGCFWFGGIGVSVATAASLLTSVHLLMSSDTPVLLVGEGGFCSHLVMAADLYRAVLSECPPHLYIKAVSVLIPHSSSPLGAPFLFLANPLPVKTDDVVWVCPHYLLSYRLEAGVSTPSRCTGLLKKNRAF